MLWVYKLSFKQNFVIASLIFWLLFCPPTQECKSFMLSSKPPNLLQPSLLYLKLKYKHIPSCLLYFKLQYSLFSFILSPEWLATLQTPQNWFLLYLNVQLAISSDNLVGALKKKKKKAGFFSLGDLSASPLHWLTLDEKRKGHLWT